MKKILLLIGVSCTLLLLSECKSTKTTTVKDAPKPEFYEPTESNASAHQVSLADLNSGRKVFLDNCGKCHRLYQPSKHDLAGWKETVTRMQPKAQISDLDRDLVIKYLSSEK